MKPRGYDSNFMEVELPQPQSARARCYGVIDMGIVDNSYKNEVKTAHKIMLMWELPDFRAVFSEGGTEQPFAIFEEYTYTTGDKGNLSKLVSAWRNKPFTQAEKDGDFDCGVFLNKTAYISFTVKRKGAYKNEHIDKVTNKNSRMALNTIMPLPKPMKEGMPQAMNKLLLFDWDKVNGPNDLDMDLWNSIPNFVKKKIRTSEEYQQRQIATVDKDAGEQSHDQQYSSSNDAGSDDDDFGTPQTYVGQPVQHQQPPAQQQNPPTQPPQQGSESSMDTDDWS